MDRNSIEEITLSNRFKRNCFIYISVLIAFFLFGCLPKPKPPRMPNELLSEIEPFYKVFKPNIAPPFPVVILLHGAQIEAWREDIETLKDELVAANYAVVFVDSYANRNLNVRSILNGKMLPAERSGDLIVTVDWVRNQPWCDKERIAVWGQSHGAATIMDTLVLISQKSVPTSLIQIPANGLQGVKAAVLFFPWCQDRVLGVELVKAVENEWEIPIPILAIIPGKDKFAPLCTQVLKREKEKGFPIEIVNFPNEYHSFSAKSLGPSMINEHYNQKAAIEAYNQTKRFLSNIFQK